MKAELRDNLKEFFLGAKPTYKETVECRSCWMLYLDDVADLGLREAELKTEEQFKNTLVGHRLYTQTIGPRYSEVSWVHAGWRDFCAKINLPSCLVIGTVAAWYLSTIVDETKRQVAVNELERLRHISAEFFTWSKVQPTVTLSKDLALFETEFALCITLAKTPLAEWQSVRDIQIPDLVYCDKNKLQSE